MSDTTPVTIYSTPWCAFCKTEMQWMDKLGVPYVKKDIESDESAFTELMQKTGGQQTGVPVTDINGDLILGFDRPKLQAALEKNDLVKSN